MSLFSGLGIFTVCVWMGAGNKETSLANSLRVPEVMVANSLPELVEAMSGHSEGELVKGKTRLGHVLFGGC